MINYFKILYFIILKYFNSQLKIADFGFARFLNEEDMAATLCGSPIYMVSYIFKEIGSLHGELYL